jgi:putative FmdB family regulatory protein
MRFDYRCPACGVTYEDIASTQGTQVHCIQCGKMCERLPAAPNFAVKGYNARNGYTRKEKA